MSPLQDLDRLLVNAETDFMTYQEVYQSDAFALLLKFTDDDWAELRGLWKRRSPDWQLVLARLLEDGPPKETVPILVEMLESTNIELMEQALDVLPQDLPSIVLSDQTIARLLKKPERFAPNAFLGNPNLPRLLKAAGHPVQEK